MRKYLVILPLLILATATQHMSNAQNVPLIDRDLFFGNPEISGGQLSPDGKYISFLKEYEGIMNIWVKTFDAPFEDARPLTDSKRPLYGYFWTLDGKYILYAKDKDGDENINIFAVDPSAVAEEVPESRNLTPVDEVTARIYNLSDEDPDLMMIGLNDRDKAWHDLYELRISTGELKMVYENNDRITGYNFDWDDNLRILSRTDEKGNTVMLRKEGDDLVPIYETSVTESAYVAGWTPDNSAMYLVTNKGDLNLSTLFLMDPVTQELTLKERDPKGKVDFGSLRLDRNTREIISTSYTDDRSRIYWRNKDWEKAYKFLKKKFPGREVGFQSSTLDYSKFLISVYGDKYASESWFYDRESGDLIRQYTPRPDLKEVEEYLSPMESVKYKSSDGLEIPAYLTLPAGMKGKNLPVVILVHGGPKGPRDYWGYDAQAQFLANRGYAVLQPNFRASGGFGKEFLNAGDLEWGRLMQDDITWGVKHLINKGIADESRVAIMGGSYGGYATLAGLAFTPDLYACGVDIVGPSNIFTLLESVPAYWESGRAFLYGMVGDPNTEEGRKRIEEASPLFSADKIKKPLLIIQGANDPRVKKAEADQIAIALRDRGHEVSYLLAEDEGHGFAKPVNRMAMFAEIERFLAEHIGGRYQEDMPDDVAERLGTLKVDIATVEYSPAEETVLAEELPDIVPTFAEGKTEYNVTIAVQGQNIPMKTTRTVTMEGDRITVKDESESPQGKASEVMTYGTDLRPVSRSLTQAGQQIDMEYRDEKIAVSAMGNNIEIPFEGALLPSGSGYEYLVAGMPLSEGYSISVLMPDISTMKAKQVVLSAVGTESAEGKECLRVEITAVENDADRTVIWIDQNTREVVKTEQTVPAMQNAVLTTVKAD